MGAGELPPSRRHHHPCLCWSPPRRGGAHKGLGIRGSGLFDRGGRRGCLVGSFGDRSGRLSSRRGVVLGLGITIRLGDSGTYIGGWLSSWFLRLLRNGPV